MPYIGRMTDTYRFFFHALVRTFSVAAIAYLIAIAASGAHAQEASEDPEGAADFIATLSDNAVAVWSDATKTEAERQEAFRELLYDGFDVNFIAKLVLGRHIRTASPDQLREYQKLFPGYIINSFARRIGDYGNEKLVITGTVPTGKRDLFVRTQIVRPNGEPILADWRIRKVKDAFQIVDIKVEGISLAVTQRDEFASIIERKGFDGLLETLRSDTVDVAQNTNQP